MRDRLTRAVTAPFDARAALDALAARTNLRAADGSSSNRTCLKKK